jgi:hypothetical protein
LPLARVHDDIVPAAFPSPRRAAVIGLAWGFAEATFFFVVPDVWVGYASTTSTRSGLAAAAGAAAGGLIGAVAVSALIGFGLQSQVLAWLQHVPAIRPSMLEVVGHRIDVSGPASLLPAAFEGIPYKVYSTLLLLRGTPLVTILVWTVPSRVLRLFPVALVFAGLTAPIRKWILRRRVLSAALYFGLWACFYGWYWTHLP